MRKIIVVMVPISIYKCKESNQIAPFSAPETQAISKYVSSLANVVSYIDVHSYTQLWMFPWGYTCSKKIEDYKLLNEASKQATAAMKGVNGLTFAYGGICETIYPAAGSSIDWTYGEKGIHLLFLFESS